MATIETFKDTDTTTTTTDTDTTTKTTTTITNSLQALPYNSKKPKWWKKCSGTMTKGQRRILQSFRQVQQQVSQKEQKNQEQQFEEEQDTLFLPTLPYGTYIHWDDIFVMNHTNTNIDTDTEIDKNNNNNNKNDENCCKNSNQKKEKEIWIEIGFGNGENLLGIIHLNHIQIQQQQQQQEQDEKQNDEQQKYNHNDRTNRYYIGIEIHSAGIGNIITKIYHAQQKQQYWDQYDLYTNTCHDHDKNDYDGNIGTGSTKFLNHNRNPNRIIPHEEEEEEEEITTEKEKQEPNIIENEQDNGQPSPRFKSSSLSSSASIILYSKHLRLFGGDGMKFLTNHVLESSVHAIVIPFPDPFFKSLDEQQYRIVQVSTLLQIYRVLQKPKPIKSKSKSTSSSFFSSLSSPPPPSLSSSVTDTTTTTTTTNEIIEDEMNQMDLRNHHIHCTYTEGGGGRLYLATDHLEYYHWIVQDQIPLVNELILQMNKNNNKNENTNTATISGNEQPQEQEQQQHQQQQQLSGTGEEKEVVILYQQILPCPDRQDWLPVISKYERKGWDEGRSTHLACWELKATTITTTTTPK